MALTREKKEQIFDELKYRIKDAEIVIFVNFHGLNTILIQELRRLISRADAKYLVAKKTLIKKSLDEFKFSGDMPELEGEVALVFSKREVNLPANILFKFGKKHPEISLLGGVFEGMFVGKESVVQLANLPTKDVLIGQFINVINAPRQQTVGVLRAPIRDFVSVLKQIK